MSFDNSYENHSDYSGKHRSMDEVRSPLLTPENINEYCYDLATVRGEVIWYSDPAENIAMYCEDGFPKFNRRLGPWWAERDNHIGNMLVYVWKNTSSFTGYKGAVSGREFLRVWRQYLAMSASK